MPLSTETIPNKPLNGEELKRVILDNVRQRLDSDCFFNATIAYTRCAFSFTITVHGAGLQQAVEVRSRTKAAGAIEGEAPLENVEENDSQFTALQRDVKVDSPNLTRIHHGMPITTQVKQPPPTANDPFPSFELQKITYEPGDHPPLAEPKDTDVTEEAAKKLGVKTAGARARQRMYDKVDKGDD